jgi:hypothetical protein
MKTLILLAIAVSCTLVAPNVSAETFNCTPIRVDAMTDHVDVLCSPGTSSSPSIIFFAVATSNADNAQRFLTLATAAMLNNKPLSFLYSMSDTTGPSFGCALADCRPVSGIFVAH